MNQLTLEHDEQADEGLLLVNDLPISCSLRL